MDGQTDVRTDGRTDGKSPYSTGLRPLSGPLPKKRQFRLLLIKLLKIGLFYSIKGLIRLLTRMGLWEDSGILKTPAMNVIEYTFYLL